MSLSEIRTRNQATFGWRAEWTEAERDRADLVDLVVWLIPYARHSEDCVLGATLSGACTCRLEAVLARL